MCVCVTPVIELTELLKKLQIISFHLVVPIPFGEKRLSFGGFHSVELQITPLLEETHRLEQGWGAWAKRNEGER